MSLHYRIQPLRLQSKTKIQSQIIRDDLLFAEAQELFDRFPGATIVIDFAHCLQPEDQGEVTTIQSLELYSFRNKGRRCRARDGRQILLHGKWLSSSTTIDNDVS